MAPRVFLDGERFGDWRIRPVHLQHARGCNKIGRKTFGHLYCRRGVWFTPARGAAAKKVDLMGRISCR